MYILCKSEKKTNNINGYLMCSSFSVGYKHNPLGLKNVHAIPTLCLRILGIV